MSLVRLQVDGISYSQTEKGAYALILNELEGDRMLPIVIGTFEAQSISIALEQIKKPSRPLTHDLFKNFADRFDIVLNQVIIHKLVNGLFYSSLICERDKMEEIIDARTSDAIALALRFDAPIFTYENILDNAGVYLQLNSLLETKIKNVSFDLNRGFDSNVFSDQAYSKYTLEELHLFLKTFVKNEDYEKAVQIRDEISKRKAR